MSVCPVDRQQQQRPAGLLLSPGTRSYRSIAAGRRAAGARAALSYSTGRNDPNDSVSEDRRAHHRPIVVQFRVAGECRHVENRPYGRVEPAVSK